jgi:hypothetical protein
MPSNRFSMTWLGEYLAVEPKIQNGNVPASSWHAQNNSKDNTSFTEGTG